MRCRARCSRSPPRSHSAAEKAENVEIAGLDPAQAANVRAHLELDEEACDAPEWRVEQEYAASPAKIRTALEALGYYEPRIDQSLDRTPQCWHAKFAIRVGPPTLVRKLDVELVGEAAKDSAFVSAREQSPVKAGAVLNHGDYEALKRRWLDLAVERGYADAKFTENRIDVYPEQRVADIVLHFDSGKRYRFGAISFQQDVLSDDLIHSYMKIRRGDPYDGRGAQHAVHGARQQRLFPQHRGSPAGRGPRQRRDSGRHRARGREAPRDFVWRRLFDRYGSARSVLAQ